MKILADQPYEGIRKLVFTLCGEQVGIISKPGIPDWNQLRPSTILLAENAEIHANDDVLIIGSHHGALSAFISRHLSGGILSVLDNNYISLEMTSKTLGMIDSPDVKIISSVELPIEDERKYIKVFIDIPKGRKLARRWLIQAKKSLVEGGQCYIAGANSLGIQSIIMDAERLFGNSQVLAFKKGNRVARLIKGSEVTVLPDWVDEPGIAPGSWVEFVVTIHGQSYNIRSLAGVFSYDHLDPGTEMLVNTIDFLQGAQVLDVGCGYGMIGMVAIKLGAGWVDLIDNDYLAVAACKETLAINQITNVTAYPGDLLSTIGMKKYDLILSNPPFHAGQAVDYQIAQALIRQSYNALNGGGRIIIVANRFIQYDQLIKQIFGNISIMNSSGKFHVLCAIKQPKLLQQAG
jgi:16S rRNA (guanine1207-N2)-methyltransferase